MTSNRTIKTTFARSLLVATGLIGMALISNVHADEASKNPAANQIASVQPASPVRNEPCFNLRVYGDRFEQAIKAIEKDAGKPDWAWDDSDDNENVARND